MLDIICSQLPVWVGLFSLLGLCMGSFFNVLIHRLPRILETQWRQECQTLLGSTVSAPARYNVALPASQCPHCSTPIQIYDNIPLFSYLWLRGCCRHCQHPIGWRYPVVEFGTALLTGYLAYRFGATAALIPALLLTWALIPLAFIDAEHMILPDVLVLGTLWIGLVGTACNLPGLPPPSVAIIGAAAGYLSLWSIYWLFWGLTGKEGLGYGDFKLFALLGVWLGWAPLPFVITLASTTGAIVGLIGIARGQHTRQSPMPFGPYLIGAGWIAYIFELPTIFPFIF